MSGARPTPYDIVFADPSFEEGFRAIGQQLGGAQPDGALALAQLTATGEVLRALLPENDAGVAHGAVFTQVSQLVYHAFTFRAGGRHVYRIGEAAFRRLISSEHTQSSPPEPPHAAGYMQVPRTILWARVAESAPPEPVDGFFWHMHAPRLDLLLALGVRPARPGVSLIDVSLDDVATLVQWRDAAIRPDGVDFANVLPGGELQGYHALTLRGEVLKLAALCFSAVHAAAGAGRSENHNVVHDIDG